MVYPNKNDINFYLFNHAEIKQQFASYIYPGTLMVFTHHYIRTADWSPLYIISCRYWPVTGVTTAFCRRVLKTVFSESLMLETDWKPSHSALNTAVQNFPFLILRLVSSNRQHMAKVNHLSCSLFYFWWNEFILHHICLLNLYIMC